MPQNFEIKERKGMKRFVLGVVVICWATIVFAAGNGGKVTGTLSGKMNKAKKLIGVAWARLSRLRKGK